MPLSSFVNAHAAQLDADQILAQRVLPMECLTSKISLIPCLWRVVNIYAFSKGLFRPFKPARFSILFLYGFFVQISSSSIPVRSPSQRKQLLFLLASHDGLNCSVSLKFFLTFICLPIPLSQNECSPFVPSVRDPWQQVNSGDLLVEVLYPRQVMTRSRVNKGKLLIEWPAIEPEIKWL
jgi:hypothetical protein